MFLIDQIKSQKLLELETEIAAFIEEKGISERAMIYEMTFSKSVFKEEKEVREYLKDKYCYDYNVTEVDGNFVAVVMNVIQLDLDTSIELDLRRGIKVKAADLLPISAMENISFNEKDGKVEIRLANKIETVELNNGLPYIIEVARVAKGNHPAYGDIEITQDHLESFVKNFKAKVTGIDLAINEDHKKNEAFGWYKELFLSYDKQKCYAQVAWNTKGISALSNKEYRYFSPEIRFNYVNQLNGQSYGATLVGGALTNYPFLQMDAIVEFSNKFQRGKTVEKTTIDLSVHNATVVELSTKLQKAQTDLAAKDSEIAGLNSKVTDLNKKVNDLEAAAAKTAKEAANKKLFDDGHINAAQLTALNEGKGLVEVLALNTKLNTDGKGTTTPKKETLELNADEKKIADQFNLTPEEFHAAN